MRRIWVSLVAAAFAHAQECDDVGGVACAQSASSLVGSSLLQHAGRKLVTALEREEERREKMIDGVVERVQLALAGLVREGVSKADAMALGKDYSASLKAKLPAMTELSSSATYDEIEQERLDVFHGLVCHVRQAEGDCSAEWTHYAQAGVDFITNVGTNLLQLVNGKSVETDMAHASGRGQTDQTLLEGLTKTTRLSLASMVKLGEDPESARLIFSDAMDRLSAMDGEEEIAFSKLSPPQLARKYLKDIFHTACLPSTGSCTDILTDYAKVVYATAHPDGGVGSSLLQAGVRPVVQLAMKVLGVPEFPKETKAERTAVVKAYLKKRGIHSG